MQLIDSPEKSSWPELLKRPALESAGLEKKVKKILEKIKTSGDRALRKYTTEFDGVAIKRFQVSAHELKEAEQELGSDLKEAIRLAANNIRNFHLAQQQPIEKIETMPGVICWRKSVGIDKVGLYIPGGTAPLFSTLLMLGIPAKIAGCKEIVLCSPPGKDGRLHPAILYAAQVVGVTSIFKCGGVQAIGAMAYGTASIPKVYKIFGPGNQYVTCAKQLVQQHDVAIDMPAGPSEVAVLADANANPAYIAADLLSQAEHGADSQVLMVTTHKPMLYRIEKAVMEQLDVLPRKQLAEKSLANSKLVYIENIQDAMEMLNEYAPEHLILHTDNAEELAGSVTNAGSVFIGAYSPESVGDYASGTNHTLPTNGYAKAYSGVSLDSFVKKITFQQLTLEGLKRIGPSVEKMAMAEGLQAHANAVTIRL